MNLEEKTIGTQEVFNGRIIRVRVDKVELADGQISSREIVEHNGGVAVAALNEEGKLLMVKQYRKPFECVTLEIPAGKLEKGEDPEKCGRRELHEETGYVAKDMVKLGELYPTPGYCAEKITVYFTKDMEKSSQMLDDDEFLDVCSYTIDDLYKMVENGEIRDAKTAYAILRLKIMQNE